MKTLISILLIIVMGSSNHKEIDMPMIREDGRTERQAMTARPAVTTRPPAWLGARRPIGRGGSGFGNAGAGGSVPTLPSAAVPGWVEPMSQTAGDQYAERYGETPGGPAWNQTTAGARPPQITPGGAVIQRPPAWMPPPSSRSPSIFNQPTFNPRTGQRDPVQDGNVYNLNPTGVTEQGTPNMGTTSFIGGGGDAVVGIDELPVFPWMTGTNTFIAANGQAVRGPQPNPLLGNFRSGDPNGGVVNRGVVGGGGNGGFGTYYRGWGGGGGGGYGYDAPAWMSNDPRYMNLYSWNI